MTPRERWLAVLQRRTPDRVPMDYWTTPEFPEKLKRYLGIAEDDELYRRFHIDRPRFVYPRYAGPRPDPWGLEWTDADYGAGHYSECATHPLQHCETVADIEREYQWPSPEWFDFSSVPDQIEQGGEYPLQTNGMEPFMIYKWLRGDEQAFVDLALYPEIVHHVMNRIFDLHYALASRILEMGRGRIVYVYITEDFGSQNDLLYSPAHVREFMLPNMKRFMQLARDAGAYVFTHSDGAIRKIIPDLIDAGSDILNPIQWRCTGMERESLKRDFGGRLIFHGGVDNQQTLPFGTVNDVRSEVRDNLRILGAGGGYILAPCHMIQAITPPENVVAMYEEGYACGRR